MNNNFDHFREKINLQQLNGAVVGNCDLGYGHVRCLVLPIAETHLKEDDLGVWLECAGIRIQGSPFEQTHILKQQLPKAVLESMSVGERRNLPVLGGVQPFKAGKDFIAPEVMNVDIHLTTADE